MQDISIKKVQVDYATVADKAVNFLPIDSLHIITEAEKEYPEFSMFGELPVWGFYVRHVNGLRMKKVLVKMNGKDFRSAFLFDDVKALKLKNVKASGSVVKPEVVVVNGG